MVKKQLLSFAACVAFVAAGVVSAAEVNVYSARSEELIKPALDRFSEETGIEVNLITESADALIRRIELEGANSPADVLLTVDAGRLFRAKEAGILAPLESDILTQRIPAAYRDPDNQWFGLSLRSRVIMFDKSRVSAAEISRYEDLADRTKRRAAMAADPAWQAYLQKSREYMKHMNNKILVPTSFSPTK